MTRHVVAHDGTRHPFGFQCLHCGALLGVSLPVSVEEFGASANAFVVKHRDCPEPAAAAPAPSTAPRRCAKCGLAENEHDVRHVFVPAGGRR